jgi:uncharacterized protein YeaO (DUF488 family)
MKIKEANVQLKRAYDPPKKSDGTRVLVDRIWPRGVKKADAEIQEWMKDIAPSSSLRKWFGHDPEKWQEFRSRYRAELKKKPEQLEHLCMLVRKGPTTLIYSARDQKHNNAVALRDLILSEFD